MDYLAEVTMSILQKQKDKDPMVGYARDLVPLFENIVDDLVRKNIIMITNGGGVNPLACRDVLRDVAKRKGYGDLRIAVVCGDDILDSLDAHYAAGITFENMETGEQFSTIRPRVRSANVYFGAAPIAEALDRGAQVVITGRTTDTGLTLAPMIHEFGWPVDDWNRLAAGTVAGHILECGGQASGGNFSGDWRSVPDLAHIGFPIVEAFPDGSFAVTKHDGTGGLVSLATVKEQLLYEIGDPAAYITPDCIADFTSIHATQSHQNRVEVEAIRGRPATGMYKASLAFMNGYTAFGTLTYAWPDALDKARCADEILRKRLEDAGAHFEEIRTEFLGYDSCFGPRAEHPECLNEVVMRIGVRSPERSAVDRFSREIAPLILTGPPSVTGFSGGRPKPSEVIAYWPSLVPKTAVAPEVLL
jgi:hypothetical protein